MSNVEAFPGRGRRSRTELESLMSASPATLDAIPGAVYLCDKDGWLVRYNSEAADLWGRKPPVGVNGTRLCGSHRLFLIDGTPLAVDDCPMAAAVYGGVVTRNAEVIMERPDGSRFVALVNIRPLKDPEGRIEGAINCFQDISAYQAVSQELQHRNEELEDFFNNSAVGLHIVSGEGIILRANQAELSLLGYQAEEYVGRHIAEFHADAPVIGDILQRLSRGEKLEGYPARLRAKDGSIRHVVITSNGRFSNDKLVNTRCFTVDVSGVHAAEAARRESEERLTATYEAATIGIAEAGPDGRLMRVNDAICKMLGRSREQLLSMTFYDYTHPDEVSADAALYQRQVAGELDRYVLRKRALKADGTIVFLDIHSSSVRDTEGFRYGVRIIQDVTEAQHLEDRLREGERHLRDLLEALPAAVYTTDAEGRITFFNRAAVDMAGRAPQQGDKWCVTWRLFNPDGSPLPHDECPMAIALKEDRPVRGAEAIAERPDGSRVPFIPYPTPLHDADGRLVGAINMLVDITERKLAENRQKTLIDELNHRVKNTLATVQSLAAQTARHAVSAPDLYEKLEARLLALSRAHDLLTRRHWENAPLKDLVKEIVSPLNDGGAERLRIEGPSIHVSTREALNLTMVLNELATNAVKYGALAIEGGNVDLNWAIERQGDTTQLLLTWREVGGPAVTPPTRRGLGSRLMERCIERDLGGELDLAYFPEGLVCGISIPFALETA
ncbi:histidine kinase [Ensifer sp. Root423]|uniref:PAS domain-containing sensor histidine kinase n=1 Tax=Ensifer sp. Root423 TaxID=1736534 RepID=UPI0007143CE5|nr:PAS domain S-box protein [Ensifer sp. Root423]KQX03041.1 histidine kinase [Ensifer sp. Root423]